MCAQPWLKLLYNVFVNFSFSIFTTSNFFEGIRILYCNICRIFICEEVSWWWQIKLMLRLTLNLEMLYLIVKWGGKQNWFICCCHSQLVDVALQSSHSGALICFLTLLNKESKMCCVRSWITLFLLNCVTWHDILRNLVYVMIIWHIFSMYFVWRTTCLGILNFKKNFSCLLSF